MADLYETLGVGRDASFDEPMSFTIPAGVIQRQKTHKRDQEFLTFAQVVALHVQRERRHPYHSQ